jgi:TrmH family RNA methyltransferase
VLVIGNEGNGISDEVKAVATHRLCLPMRGGAESLNAAVAAGIMMYDLTR